MDITIKGAELETKEKQLTKMRTDTENWLIYYLDGKLLDKWVKEYPDSSYHGGGEPQLRKIEKFPWE
jgi:hypothetical protein